MKIKVKTIIIALLAVILLFPMKLYYKDGGSVEYRAILYSVTRYHRLAENMDGYLEGWKVTVLGITLHDDIPD